MHPLVGRSCHALRQAVLAQREQPLSVTLRPAPSGLANHDTIDKAPQHDNGVQWSIALLMRNALFHFCLKQSTFVLCSPPSLSILRRGAGYCRSRCVFARMCQISAHACTARKEQSNCLELLRRRQCLLRKARQSFTQGSQPLWHRMRHFPSE